MIRIALVGQPNCGKSTLFNSAAGYKTVVSNFPGTTIDFTASRVSLNGEKFELVDLPGLYSLTSTDTEERAAIDYLFARKADAIINIVDASILSRSLELTLELLELRVPLVLCLNMIDEAERKGIRIDVRLLEETLGVPVVCTIASRGQGISDLFKTVVRAAKGPSTGRTLLLSIDVERSVSELISILDAWPKVSETPPRMIALKLLERDEAFESTIRAERPEIIPDIERLRRDLWQSHGRPSDVVMSSERHSLAVNVFEKVAKVRQRARRSLGERADPYFTHPLWGYLFLGLILFFFFNGVFRFGKIVEVPLVGLFDRIPALLAQHIDRGSLLYVLIQGLVQGVSGGIGIVLPYLVPFLLGLALLEDIGYLPRAAFLMDTIMHRIGLHGKALIPFVLGYGCNVPAVMSVKTLESSRDRFITAMLVCFVPCAARSTIIFALTAFYLGPNWALLLYILNVFVVGLVGRLLSRMRPELSPGLIMEIPSYRWPSFRSVLKKIWFRLREFVVLAWPLLIGGSLVLGLLEYFRLAGILNWFFSPFTKGLLGLPSEVSITLIFGILRKELSLIMLVQALGTSDFASVMTEGQIMVFTVFSMFYMPCLATMAMLRSVIGIRGMISALALTTMVATAIAVLFRLFYLL